MDTQRRTAQDQMDELDGPECWGLLRRSEVGRLAVSIADHPDIFPINYVVDGETIVFRTGAGTKLAAAVLGKGVAFEIDGYDPLGGEAWSVVVKGHARQVEQMIDYFRADELPLFPWHASAKPDIVRIVPDIVTGRRFHVLEQQALGTPVTGADRVTSIPPAEHRPPAHTKPYMSPD